MSIKSFELSNEELHLIEHEKSFYEDARAASIEALKIVQKKRGWISDEAILAIAKILGVCSSNIEEVATFYNNIFRQPVGKHVIRYCDSIVCYINGYTKIKDELEQCLHITTGQTTLDRRFTLLPICCLGNCDKSPTMMVNDDTYTHLTPKCINRILEQYQ